MKKTPKEMLKVYVDSQKFNSIVISLEKQRAE